MDVSPQSRSTVINEIKRRRPAVPSLLIPIAAIGLSAWILRHLGFPVGLFVESGEGDKFDLAEIFSQTRDAALTLHWILPLSMGKKTAVLMADAPERAPEQMSKP